MIYIYTRIYPAVFGFYRYLLIITDTKKPLLKILYRKDITENSPELTEGIPYLVRNKKGLFPNIRRKKNETFFFPYILILRIGLLQNALLNLPFEHTLRINLVPEYNDPFCVLIFTPNQSLHFGTESLCP